MGQLLFLRKAADSLIWAHHAAQVYCQWPRSGWLFHLTDAADARVWAHCCCLRILLMVMNWLAISPKQMLPIRLHGPILAAGEHAHDHELAHSLC